MSVEPIQIRHLEIQQDHVWRVFLNPFKRFPSRSSLTTNAPRALQLKESAKIVPYSRIVICHQDSNQAETPFQLVFSS
jgi:hypothetical protein